MSSASSHVRNWIKKNPNDNTKAIIDGLKNDGINIQAHAVYAVRSELKRKRTINRQGNANAVRSYLKKNPGSKDREVVAGLAAEGITVTMAAVSKTKSRDRLSRRNAQKLRRVFNHVERSAKEPKPNAVPTSDSISVETIVNVKKLLSTNNDLPKVLTQLELVNNLINGVTPKEIKENTISIDSFLTAKSLLANGLEDAKQKTELVYNILN